MASIVTILILLLGLATALAALIETERKADRIRIQREGRTQRRRTAVPPPVPELAIGETTDWDSADWIQDILAQRDNHSPAGRTNADPPGAAPNGDETAAPRGI